jgi:hypothetical protein
MKKSSTQQFIEDAIAGEWDDTNYAFSSSAPETSVARVGEWEYDERIFLDPLAWQAVGKTREWNEDYCGHWFRPRRSVPFWRFSMHRLIDHLACGKTIEEALAAIAV